MKYNFKITAKAHGLQSDKKVLFTDSGSFLGLYKRLRNKEVQDSIEIDHIYIESVTSVELK